MRPRPTLCSRPRAHARVGLAFLFGVLISVLLPALPARAEAIDLAEAQTRLERLADVLGSSRSRSEDQLDALNRVEASYLGLLPGMAGEQAAELAKWRKQAEKLYLKAFALVKLDRPNERNDRADVNVRAAEIIGRTGNVALWKDVRRTLRTRVFRAKYDTSQPVLDAAFDAIAALGDPDALAWMADEFIHTNSSPEKVVDRLVAAQQAFVKFPLENLPGRLRHAIVTKMMQLYPATETVAAQSSSEAGILSTRRFWDRIRTGAIRAAQHLSGTPRNAEGEALATMHEFSGWFRDHKSARGAPWVGVLPPQG